MTALPDVNVLIALAWPNHVHHRTARSWFRSESPAGWATTPLTEVGFVRVSSNPAAVGVNRSPHEALRYLARLCERDGHEFWADDVRLHASRIDLSRLGGHQQVTDAHLLALAAGRGGRLVTFDRGVAALSTDAGLVTHLGPSAGREGT